MDKGTKNSLIFGALVGGIYALSKHAAEKQNLTAGQINDLNSFKDALLGLQKTLIDNKISSIYDVIKENEQKRKYDVILAYIEQQMHANETGVVAVDLFKARVEHLLSSRFTAERTNTKAHAVQSQFSVFTTLPDRIDAVINKRTEIYRLLKRVFTYISAGETNDFKSEDAKNLRTLIQELKIVEERAACIIQNFNDTVGQT